MKYMVGVLLVGHMFYAGLIQAAPLTHEDCLKCHGSYEALVKKNVQVNTDSGFVNPHVYLPHNAVGTGEIPECLGCHSQHALPPPQNYKDSMASMEPCYSCHHNYEFKKCSECHNNSEK